MQISDFVCYLFTTKHLHVEEKSATGKHAKLTVVTLILAFFFVIHAWK